MSLSASLDLQKAIIQHLKSDGAITALVAQRIYDNVPPATPFSYISYGPGHELQDSVDCKRAYRISVQIDVWSRGAGMVGRVDMMRIAGAVQWALHDADLTLDDYALVLIDYEDTLSLEDPDGLTSHGVVNFTALVEAV